MPKAKLTPKQALARLRKYCAYQERCHAEVRSKLLDLGVYGSDLEEIIVTLIQDGFLNEERFAKIYAGSKFRIKKWGRNKIRHALRMKKVSTYCIQKGMEEIDEQDYTDTLRMVIRKKMQQKEGTHYVRINHAAKYAISRGYEADMVWKLIKQIENEQKKGGEK